MLLTNHRSQQDKVYSKCGVAGAWRILHCVLPYPAYHHTVSVVKSNETITMYKGRALLLVSNFLRCTLDTRTRGTLQNETTSEQRVTLFVSHLVNNSALKAVER